MAIPLDIDDQSLVQRICDAREKLVDSPNEQLVSDLREAEHLLVVRFDPIARAFAYRKTSGRLDLGDVVQGFWLKVLGKGLLSRYEGRGGASVKSFLLGVLFRHIQDEFRKLGRRRIPGEPAAADSHEQPDTEEMPGGAQNEEEGWVEIRLPTEPTDWEPGDVPDPSPPPDIAVIEKELEYAAEQLMKQAIHELSLCYPKDKPLIELYMNGVSNQEILDGNLLKDPSLNEGSPKQRADRLKKRSERARNRFGIILMRLCLKNDMSIQDLIEHCHGFSATEFGDSGSNP